MVCQTRYVFVSRGDSQRWKIGSCNDRNGLRREGSASGKKISERYQKGKTDEMEGTSWIKIHNPLFLTYICLLDIFWRPDPLDAIAYFLNGIDQAPHVPRHVVEKVHLGHLASRYILQNNEDKEQLNAKIVVLLRE